MATLRHRILPPDLSDVLSVIASFDEESFRVLTEEIASESAFASDRARCEQVAVSTSIDPETLGVVFTTLSFLYGQVNSKANNDAEAEQILRTFLAEDFRESPDTDETGLLPRLQVLLKRRESLDFYRKLQGVKTGLVDRAIGFASLVDLRPCYSDDRNELRCLAPIVNFRITMESGSDRKDVIVQLSSQSIKDLRNELELIERKLETLESIPALAAMIDKR